MIRRLSGCAPYLVRCAVMVAAMLAFAGLRIAPAQQSLMSPRTLTATAVQPQSEPAARLDAIRTAIEDVAKDFNTNAQTEDELVALKRRLMPLRDQLRDRLADLDPRLKQIDQRINQLGTPPNSPGPEDATITAERLRLSDQRSDLESTLKQAKLLAGRALDLEDRINQRRRELFTNLLFAPSASLFDAAFWNDLAESVATELSGFAGMLSQWKVYARNNGGVGGTIAALTAIAAIGAAAWFVARWRRRLTSVPTPRRCDKALAAIIILGTTSVTTPLLIAAT